MGMGMGIADEGTAATRPHKYAAIFFVASPSLPAQTPFIHNSSQLLLLVRLNFKWPAPFGRIYMARCHFPLSAHRVPGKWRSFKSFLPFFFHFRRFRRFCVSESQESHAKSGNKQKQIWRVREKQTMGKEKSTKIMLEYNDNREANTHTFVVHTLGIHVFSENKI